MEKFSCILLPQVALFVTPYKRLHPTAMSSELGYVEHLSTIDCARIRIYGTAGESCVRCLTSQLPLALFCG